MENQRGNRAEAENSRDQGGSREKHLCTHYREGRRRHALETFEGAQVTAVTWAPSLSDFT